jgi:hypothetical protein
MTGRRRVTDDPTATSEALPVAAERATPNPELREVQREIAEMVADGLLEPTGEYRPRRDGSPGPVYRLTELGEQFVRQMQQDG